MYDIDGNGSLDKNDFECLAVRNTVIEGKGDWNEATFKKNQEVMANLWNEIAELADFNKDGEVDGKEFAAAVQKNCMNKPFGEMPPAFKAFIDQYFRSIDVDGDGSVGLTEFRVDCVNRMAYKSIADLDAAYNKLLNDEDKKVGGNPRPLPRTLCPIHWQPRRDLPSRQLVWPPRSHRISVPAIVKRTYARRKKKYLYHRG
jgi:Ca2+-binding EF-hand superfamily protein